MPDENKIIEPLVGPYAGQHVTVTAADAESAISEGWARDPYALPDPKAEAPKERTQEEYEKQVAAAEKAARRWRGEEEPEAESKSGKKKVADEPVEAKRPAAGGDEEVDRSMEADQPGDGYTTRETASRTTVSRKPPTSRR